MSYYEEECGKMQCLTQEYVGKICKIWEKLFEPEICKENLRKLIEHATNFYSELVEESLSRQMYIESEISDLKKEAEELKRLLHVDVELPCYETESVPLLRVQSEMDRSLEELREQLKLRKEQICELLLQQESLCEELGESPRALLADPLPTEREIDEFKLHLDTLRKERVERINQISMLRREIRSKLEILGITINTESEDRLLNHRQIKMSKETFNDLRRMNEKYAVRVKELKDATDKILNKLEILWDRLQTSPSTRLKFKRYSNYNHQTYDAVYNELQRCEQLKRQNIKLYVEQVRDEMRQWWDKCLKSEKEKERFSNFTCDTYTDDLLILHEMELNDLKSYYTNNKQIFDLYADRNLLWDRMSALEAKASDPGRYNNRGGQLLKEEKERKMIATKLPKIEQQIIELVEEYQQREHRPFLVYGENIIDAMAQQWEQKRIDKEKLQSERKKALTSSKSKPNSTLKTPMSMRNASSVSSLRKTPSTTSLLAQPLSSVKRKLNPTNKDTPVAKRSLLHALNSPSAFLKPSTSKNSAQPLSRTNTVNKSAILKTNIKKPKVIGTTIRRRSARQSNGMKKRKSVNKNNSSTRKIPKIIIQEPQSSDGYTTDDNYNSFQKCIEPASRSSVIYDSSSTSSSSRLRRMQLITADENERLARLPRPQINRTPSKQNLSHYTSTSHLPRNPHNNAHNRSNLVASTGRKLTTKNLPIII